jgi:hypothetical protein
VSVANHNLILLLDEPDIGTQLANKKISFFRAIIVKITWDMRELRKTYKIVRFYSLCSILGYFFTHCQVFLSNSHYALGFVSRYCVSGILPRFFAVGKPLPQG